MNNNELTLRDIFALFWTNLKWIIASAIVFAAAFLAVAALFITPKYTATATFFVYSYDRKDTSVSYSDLTASKDIAKTFSAIIKSDAVLKLACEQLGEGYSPKALSNMISCTSVLNTEILQLSVTTTDPQQSVDITNALADIAPAEIVRITKVGGAEVIDRAELPDGRSSPSYKRAVLLGGIVGFVLSFVFFFAKKLLDTVVRTEEDLMNNFDYPILGVVPQIQISDVADSSSAIGGDLK